jgi:hypothetical protein
LATTILPVLCYASGDQEHLNRLHLEYQKRVQLNKDAAEQEIDTLCKLAEDKTDASIRLLNDLISITRIEDIKSGQSITIGEIYASVLAKRWNNLSSEQKNYIQAQIVGKIQDEIEEFNSQLTPEHLAKSFEELKRFPPNETLETHTEARSKINSGLIDQYNRMLNVYQQLFSQT